VFFDIWQGLLDGVSPSQGLHTQDSITQKDEDKHSRLERHSNPRSQGRSDKDPRPRQSGHCDRLQVIIRTDVTLGGLVVSALATGPKVRRFKLGRGQWIFDGDKNPWHNFLRRDAC
jgi:hypothetical protein